MKIEEIPEDNDEYGVAILPIGYIKNFILGEINGTHL